MRTNTPMFTKDFLPEGRIHIGDVTIFPNLTGHAEKSILAILSKEHHLKLPDFTPELILNAFQGATTYLAKLNETQPDVKYPVFIFNYLPPAGSSIFHPHMQILVRDRPFYLAKLVLEKSKAYHAAHRSSYWSDLIAMEKQDERHIATIGGVEWLSPFAPLRGINEIQAIVNNRSNFLELARENWTGLVQGISRTLKFYGNQGYTSFNIILLSGPLDEHLDCFDVNLRIMGRPGIQTTSFTDAWALPYYLWDGEATEEPEKLAARIKKEF